MKQMKENYNVYLSVIFVVLAVKSRYYRLSVSAEKNPYTQLTHIYSIYTV